MNNKMLNNDGSLINYVDEELLQAIAHSPDDALNVIRRKYPRFKTLVAAKKYLFNKLSSTEVRGRLSDLLDAQGLSLVNLNNKLNGLTAADKGIILDGEIKYIPDNPTRLEAVKTGYKLHKVISDNNVMNINSTKIVGISLQADTLDRLTRINDKLSTLHKEMQASDAIIVNGVSV